MLDGGLWPGSCTATLQQNPTQLTRMLRGLGWQLSHPSVEVMYRSPVDIYIDEWVHDLLQAAERTQARPPRMKRPASSMPANFPTSPCPSWPTTRSCSTTTATVAL